MSDLISRKYLLRWLRDYQLENYAEVGHEKEYNFIENLIKGIENEPTAEPVRGEWIDMRETYNDVPQCKCSVCGAVRFGLETNFCPNCGADMRKKVE